MSQSHLNEKEQRILEAAQKLFARFGPKKTSIDEIAQQAGLGKGTIYLYFRSKDDLHTLIVRRFGEEMVARMKEAASQAQAPGEKLRLLVEARLQFVQDHIKAHDISPEVLSEFEDQERSPNIGPVIREFSEIQVQMIREIIALGVATGEFTAKNPELTAIAIYSALHTCGKPWPCEGKMMIESQDKVAAFVNLFLYGLKHRSDPTH